MARGLACCLSIGSLLAWAALGVAHADAQESGKKYALLIGVEGYDPAQLTKLEYAEDDVIELGKALEQLGFTVIVMTSKSDIPARRPSTAKKIHDQFDGLLKRVQSEQDMLVVVLSGHGLQYRDDPVDDEGAKETYFCPEEAVSKDRGTLVPISPLSKKLAGSKALKRLLVDDACRNEVASKLNKAVEETIEAVGRRARTEQRGMLTLFSCAPKEKSWEHPDVGHGVFTSYMLKYLKGEAEPQMYPRDQCSIQQLAAYTSRETSDFVFRRLNQDQSPDLVGRSNDWSFGKRGGGSLAKEFISKSTGLKLTLIPAGTFQMGSPAGEARRFPHEGPQHTVRISQPFYMGVYEATQAEYESVMGTNTNPSSFSKTGRGSSKVSGMNTGKFPVETVSWFDAVEFCNKLSVKDGLTPYYSLTSVTRDGGTIKSATVSTTNGNGYRLPTDAEWEYACRANTTTPFHFGGTLNGDGDKANVDGSVPYGTTTKGLPKYLERPTTVGAYAKNDFGLFDMHGNVLEWCEDVYDESAYGKRSGTTSDPKVTSGSGDRVLRGGSWNLDSGYARSAFRFGSTPDNRLNYLGFRVVLSSAAVRTP